MTTPIFHSLPLTLPQAIPLSLPLSLIHSFSSSYLTLLSLFCVSDSLLNYRIKEAFCGRNLHYCGVWEEKQGLSPGYDASSCWNEMESGFRCVSDIVALSPVCSYWMLCYHHFLPHFFPPSLPALSIYDCILYYCCYYYYYCGCGCWKESMIERVFKTSKVV